MLRVGFVIALIIVRVDRIRRRISETLLKSLFNFSILYYSLFVCIVTVGGYTFS